MIKLLLKMKNFKAFYRKLLDNPSTKTTLLIKGERKKIKAMARFTTVNYPKDQYIKIVFDDHSFLLVLPGEKEIYYSDKIVGQAKGIADRVIGKKKIIYYKGKEYELGNKNDYQFCLQLHVGKPLEIEGECRFSDYFPVKGPKEFLSLGWLSYTGKRADINPQIIDLKDVEII